MPEPYRVGILGAGRIAGLNAEGAVDATHAGAMARAGRFEIAGICDVDVNRACLFARQWGGRVANGVGELLDQTRPDVVVISAPDAVHATLAREVLESAAAPRLLVIEKPPCLSRTELDAIVSTAAARPQVKTIVNLNRRFDDNHQSLAAAITRGDFGELLEAAFTYYGGWFHNGVHAVDVLRMLIGGRLNVISSAIGADGRPGDPCRDVHLSWSGSRAARIWLRGFDERAFQVFELEMRFTGGRVRMEDFGRRIVVERIETNTRGERELRPTGEWRPARSSCHSMLGLYDACAAYLSQDDEQALDEVTIAAVVPTMEILFDAA